MSGTGLLRPAARCHGAGTRVDLVWQAVGLDERWDVFQAENTAYNLPGTWTKTAVTNNTDVTSHVPGVTLKGNTLNVLWADNADPAWKVRGSLASDAVSGDNAFLPDVAAKDADTVYAVYSRVNDTTDDYDIYWNRSGNGGVLWPFETLLGASADPSLYPSVTYDQQGQHAWVVWREGNGPNWEIKGQQIVDQ